MIEKTGVTRSLIQGVRRDIETHLALRDAFLVMMGKKTDPRIMLEREQAEYLADLLIDLRNLMHAMSLGYQPTVLEAKNYRRRIEQVARV